MFIEVFFLIHLALIPTFIREFGLSLFQASLIATVPSITVLLSYIPAGLLVDKVGPKPVLLVSMILEGVSALLIGQVRDYTLLVLAISMIKVSSPIYHTCGLSAISRMSDSGSTGKMLGFHNAMGSLGATIGLFSLSIFGASLGWRFVYLFWSIPVLIWCIPILKTESTRYAIGQANTSARRVKLMDFKSVLSFKFALLLCIVSLRDFGATAVSTFLTTYMVQIRGLSQETASMVYGLGPFVGILSSLVGGYLCSRIGDTKTLLYMVLGSALFLVPISFAEGLNLLMVTYLVYSFFNNGAWSPIGSLVATLTPGSMRGVGYSVYFFAEGIVAAVQPTVTAVAIEHTDLYVIFPIAIGLLSICTGLLGYFHYGISPSRTKRKSYQS